MNKARGKIGLERGHIVCRLVKDTRRKNAIFMFIMVPEGEIQMRNYIHLRFIDYSKTVYKASHTHTQKKVLFSLLS